MKILKLRGRAAGLDLNVTVATRSVGGGSRSVSRKRGTLSATRGIKSSRSSRQQTPVSQRGEGLGSARSNGRSSRSQSRGRFDKSLERKRSNSARPGRYQNQSNSQNPGVGPKNRLQNVFYIDNPRPLHNQSLNYINRKNAQTRQLEENLLILKKIHHAEPTLKISEFKKHAKEAKRLKKMVSDGSHRQSLI